MSVAVGPSLADTPVGCNKRPITPRYARIVMLLGMSSRERRLDRATRLILRDTDEMGRDLRDARLGRGLTLAEVAREVGVSASTILRTEQGRAPGMKLPTLARQAAAVGMRLRVRVFPEGPPIRDAGQVALIRDFRARVPALRLRLEAPVTSLPTDLRAFDAVTRVEGTACAIEFFTRFHDTQAQLRGVLKKQADAGIPRLIVVVRGSHANRRAVAAVADILADTLPLSTRAVLRALGEGRDPGANGLIFI